MKKILLILLAVTLSLPVLFAQDDSSQKSPKYGLLSKDAWVFGFGVTYPRYVSTNTTIYGEKGYGGFLSIQKNFSEHVGVRLKASYLSIVGNVAGDQANNFPITNTFIGGDIDLIYYLIPCEPVSPYLGVGLGGFYNSIDNAPNPINLEDRTNDEDQLDYEVNVNFGSEFRIGERWRLKAELGYHTPASSKFDGMWGTNGNGILGSYTDSYMTFDVGALYYFGLGEKSHICDLYEGLGQVDYDRIEEIVKRNLPPVAEGVDYDRIEDIIKKNMPTSTAPANNNWVLIGVNFDFNKSSLRPEAFPILYNAAEILLANPSVTVEIDGHTDNIGSDSYNMTLSQKRAQTVKDFLVSKGVAASRITTVGLGEGKPIAPNTTADGRALNRRIEFKVLSGK